MNLNNLINRKSSVPMRALPAGDHSVYLASIEVKYAEPADGDSFTDPTPFWQLRYETSDKQGYALQDVFMYSYCKVGDQHEGKARPNLGNKPYLVNEDGVRIVKDDSIWQQEFDKLMMLIGKSEAAYSELLAEMQQVSDTKWQGEIPGIKIRVRMRGQERSVRILAGYAQTGSVEEASDE